MQEGKNYYHILNQLISFPDNTSDIDIYNAGGQNPGEIAPEEALAVLRGIYTYRQHKDFANAVRRGLKKL